MSGERVLLLELKECTSAAGNRYLSGWLGKASVVAFLDRDADEPTWQVFVATPQPRTGGANVGDMRRTALQLLDGYAAIAALGAGIRGHEGAREMAEAALEGLLSKGGPQRLLNWRASHPVAPELVDLLASVTGKGDAVRAAALSQVPLR